MPRDRAALAVTARETLAVLPGILKQLPDLDVEESTVHNLKQLPALPENEPEQKQGDGEQPAENARPTVRVRVLDQDSFDAAIDLISPTANAAADRVVVLNLASEKVAGGGWRSGALAQEECLCYRSSLALSLHDSYYPLARTSAVYSPTVLIIRDAFSRGHELLLPTDASADKKDAIKPSDLPVVSVVSVAAIRRPRLVMRRMLEPPYTALGPAYADPADATLMAAKMRLTLRVAAARGHRRLVLGALGCGAFRNPTRVVAALWAQVLGEREFAGRGLWDAVVFAVLDKGSDGGNAGMDREGNFAIFHEALDGMEV